MLLLAGIGCISEIYAQYKIEKPVHIGKEQGLPTSEINSIKKGSDGFIWMGTAEGLGRFDGQQVKMYSLAEEKQGLFNGLVIPVLPLENEVWAGTDQGIAVLNKKDESFRFYQLGEKHKTDSFQRRFNQTVYLIYQDRQNDIWIGTRQNGVWLYDKKKDDFKKFDYPPEAYKPIIPALGYNYTIISITASKTNDSIIWTGTTAGLQEINKYSGKVSWYTYPQKDKFYQVSLNAFRRIYHHTDGLLYVGSWAAGMNVFDPVTKTFTPIILKDDYGKEMFGGPIHRILGKSDTELWITTTEGLVVYNTDQHKITWLKKNRPLKNEFYGVDFIDEQNRLWGIDVNGIQCFDPVVQQFTSTSYDQVFDKYWTFAYYIASDSKGDNITVCPSIAPALFYYNKKTGQWKTKSFNSKKAISRENIIVRGFLETEPGKYIISADEGLFSFSDDADMITPIRDHPPVSYNRWGNIIKDRSGNIWISADADGLIKWNRSKGSYRYFRKELTKNNSGTGFGKPNFLFEDSRNNIWFSRADGFSVYIVGKDSVLNFIYSDTPDNSFPVINNFAEDNKGRVWFSTVAGSYGYADVNTPEKGVVKKFNLPDQNVNGHFSQLATDKDGNVWGYTEKELVRINSSDLSLSAYSFLYGAPEADFFHFTFIPGGEMVFGGRNGITLARPEELTRNKELPVPYILDLKILNQPVNCSLYCAQSALHLKYNQNFVTFYFSAKAYTVPNNVRFRYRLKGFEDWIEARNKNRFANYTNIPPGDYLFQLQAANSEGIWNEKMLEIPVHIANAWWRTWWFIALEVLLVAALVYWVSRYRISQVRKKEKLKSEYERKLANVEMTALLSQMNPHFLFNSLNSIDSYIIKNESGKASEYLNNFARLMRLILQNSRSNYISLKDELETLDLYMQMEALRFKDKFQYEIKVADDIDTASIVIPPMLIQPYVENAIWHGLMHKKDGTVGKVEIILSKQEHSLVCVIQDNGIGRDKATEIKANKPGNHKRSMGMQITKDRIEMINKLYDTNNCVEVIDLKDNEEKPTGTRVKLIIPF